MYVDLMSSLYYNCWCVIDNIAWFCIQVFRGAIVFAFGTFQSVHYGIGRICLYDTPTCPRRPFGFFDGSIFSFFLPYVFCSFLYYIQANVIKWRVGVFVICGSGSEHFNFVVLRQTDVSVLLSVCSFSQ